MLSKHIKQVTAVHIKELPDDILPKLGAKFLEKNYYSSIEGCELSEVIVALRGERVIGFINISFGHSNLFYHILKRNFFTTIYYIARLSLLSPVFFFRGLLSILNHKYPILQTQINVGEVVFIAVDSSFQRRGVGKMLVEKANEHFLKKDIRLATTKTLSSNAHVVNFYRKNWEGQVFAKTKIIGRKYVFIQWVIND